MSPAVPAPAGRLTGTCSDCGKVFWVDQGHSCSGRSCACAAELADLRAQLDELRSDMGALDRGLVRVGKTASRGLKLATDIKDGVDDVHRRLLASRTAQLTPEQRRAQFKLVRGDAA